MNGDWKASKKDNYRKAHFYPEGHWWSLCAMAKLHDGPVVHIDAVNIKPCPACQERLRKEKESYGR